MALPSVGGAYIKGKGNTLHNVREGLCTKANMRECVHSRNITLEVLTFLVSELFRFHCYYVNVFWVFVSDYRPCRFDRCIFPLRIAFSVYLLIEFFFQICKKTRFIVLINLRKLLKKSFKDRFVWLPLIDAVSYVDSKYATLEIFFFVVIELFRYSWYCITFIDCVLVIWHHIEKVAVFSG